MYKQDVIQISETDLYFNHNVPIAPSDLDMMLDPKR